MAYMIARICACLKENHLDSSEHSSRSLLRYGCVLLLTLAPESFVHLVPRSPDHSTLGFVRPFYDRGTLHAAGNLSLPAIEEAYGLYSALANRSHDWQTPHPRETEDEPTPVGGGLGLLLESPEMPDWQARLHRYRIPLIVLVGLLGGLFAWHIYKRLGRPPTTGPALHQQSKLGRSS
jgi:hypothetical protein